MLKSIKILSLALLILALGGCSSSKRLKEVKKLAVVSLGFNRVIDNYDSAKDISVEISPQFRELLTLNPVLAKDVKKMVLGGFGETFDLADPESYVNSKGFKEWASQNVKSVENVSVTVPGFATTHGKEAFMRLKEAFNYLPADVDAIAYVSFGSNLSITDIKSNWLKNESVMEDYKLRTSCMIFIYDRAGKLIYTKTRQARSDRSMAEQAKQENGEPEDAIEALFLRSCYKVFNEHVDILKGKLAD